MMPRLRGPIAVIVSRFPLVTETFVLRELIELERQGQAVRIVPLIRERPPVVHPEAVPWVRRALFTPFLSPRIVAANWRALRRQPRAYLSLLGLLVRETAARPGLLARTVALFPKAAFLAERLRAEGIRHVHAHFATHPATVALIVQRLAGIDFSFTAHAHDIFVCRRLLSEKIDRARFVRAISDFNRRFLEDRYPKARGKTHVLRVGIDSDAYDAEWTPPADARAMRTILCVAALKPYKGIAVLLEAARLLADANLRFRCLVIGEGPLRRRLEARVAELGLRGRVRFLGARPQGEVATRLRACDVFVLPSVVASDGQMEGIPVAIMEAMAAGRPVVSTRLSGIPELVSDGRDGLLVPPGHARPLADALQRVLGEDAFARELGLAARKKVCRLHRLDRSVAALLERLDSEGEPVAGAARELAEAAAWPDRVVGLRWVREGEDSRAAAFVIGGGPSGRPPLEVIVKRHLERPGQSAEPLARARREYEVLSWLSSQHDVGASGPRPLRLDGPRQAVVMERCGGEPLDAVIRRFRTAPDIEPLGRAFRDAGLWLGRFQTAPVPGGFASSHPAAAREPERALGRDLERRLGLVLRISRSGPLRRSLPDGVPKEGVRRLVAAAVAQSGPPAPCHGDFWPGNVYLEGHTVRALDFEGYRTGCGWYDAGYFLAHAERYFLLVPGPRRRFRRLESAFLEGFLEGRGKPWPAPAALRLCRAATMTRLLASEVPQTGVHRLAQILLARRLLRELEGLEPQRAATFALPAPAVGSRAT